MSDDPITIATLLWAPNAQSYGFSTMYDESWVEKLYRGCKRNIVRRPMRMVCFVDQERDFKEPIEQVLIEGEPSYASCIQPYKLDVPMILVGLDTVITGNCDEMADYCFYGDRVAVPLDPFEAGKVCNGVALVPAGQKASLHDAHQGENDMDWIRSKNVAVIDKLFPGQCISYKGEALQRGIGDARIVYFHGQMKPHQQQHVGFIRRHWV